MTKIIPCREPVPDLPKESKPRPASVAFGKHELFGFDTETTTDGIKELRSYQIAYYHEDTGTIIGAVRYLEGYFKEADIEAAHDDLLEQGIISEWYPYPTVEELRVAVQQAHESYTYGPQPRYVYQGNRAKRSKRQPIRCACAFNGNFDLGAMADYTELIPELSSGGMDGAGVRYHFTSGRQIKDEGEYSMSIEALYLGAMNVPFTMQRGELWDIAPAANNLWERVGLAGVAEHLGLEKTGAFDDPRYAMMDAVITLKAAWQLTQDLEGMGFTGEPDRFISGATVSKDIMRREYEPFYLTQEEHEAVWPAYFGGMTGATRPEVIGEVVEDVVYGDLDGAYNASGQNLRVCDWDGVRELTPAHCRQAIKAVKFQAGNYWRYGSLHLVLDGDFTNCPMRVATLGDASEADPSAAQGLVWAKMSNYQTTLCIGDYLHSGFTGKILKGYMAHSTTNRLPCLFNMTATERAEHDKGSIGNTWWKLAGNCLYGSFANRNGKDRMNSGKYFNGLIASSITSAIRHAMHITNKAAGLSSHYNDTDSALMDRHSFKAAQTALADIGIGFSNKTDDELPNKKVAAFAIVHGSKRYCMVAKDGAFGAKCHGLGSWFALYKGKVRPIAHTPELLKAVWQFAYPHELGEPDPDLLNLTVFHKFSVRSERVAALVKDYARTRYGLPMAQLAPYGRAGNFGYLVPIIQEGVLKPTVSYDPREASAMSNRTLGMVAYGWSSSRDKKFDYKTGERWAWSGDEVREVKAIPHTQELIAQGDELGGDLSLDHLGVVNDE